MNIFNSHEYQQSAQDHAHDCAREEAREYLQIKICGSKGICLILKYHDDMGHSVTKRHFEEETSKMRPILMAQSWIDHAMNNRHELCEELDSSDPTCNVSFTINMYEGDTDLKEVATSMSKHADMTAKVLGIRILNDLEDESILEGKIKLL
jgi:hypothetical protein